MLQQILSNGSLQDFFEIIIIYILLCKLLIWLSTSATPLLEFFYSCCVIYLFSLYLGLDSLMALFHNFFSLMCVGFVIFHEKSLQKNMIMVGKKYQSNTTAVPLNWVELLMKVLVSRAGIPHSVNPVCVIGDIELMHSLFEVPIKVEVSYSHALCTALLKVVETDNEYFMLGSQGTIFGLKGKLKSLNDYISLVHDDLMVEQWKQEALMLTAHTGIIFVKINNDTQRCTLIAEGKIVEEINVVSALRFIKEKIKEKPKQENNYEAVFKTCSL